MAKIYFVSYKGYDAYGKECTSGCKSITLPKDIKKEDIFQYCLNYADVQVRRINENAIDAILIALNEIT